MIYLLDTTTVSDWINEHPRIDARLAGLSDRDQVIICPIVRGEVLFGIARMSPGKNRQRIESRAALAFRAFPCRPTPESAGDFYSQVRREQQQKGLSLGANDLWIAATVLALDARLVSRDTDFGRIEDFPVEDWTK